MPNAADSAASVVVPVLRPGDRQYGRFDIVAPDVTETSCLDIPDGVSKAAAPAAVLCASFITQAVRSTSKRKAESLQTCQPAARLRTADDDPLAEESSPSHKAADVLSSTGCTSAGNVDALPMVASKSLVRTPSDSSASSADTTFDEQDLEAADRATLCPLYDDDDSVCPDLPGLELQTEPEFIVDDEVIDDGEDDEEVVEFDPYVFIKHLPPVETVIVPANATLPPKAEGCDKMTLILDLDETLVHSSLDCGSDPDFSFDVTFNGQTHLVNVSERPFLHEFLNAVAGRFEVVIFTASQRVYAEQLLDILDPEGTLIDHRLYRDSCVYVEGNYLKELSGLGRDLTKTVIVDNSPHAFGFQVENGIPIESWYDDTEDEELKRLLPFLDNLATLSDVRPMVSSTFKLHEVIALADDTM